MSKNTRTIELKPNAPDMNSQDAYWLCALIPYKYADTFDRRRLSKYINGELDVSLQEALSNPASSERVLIFGDDDISDWSTTGSKSSFATGFNANLKNNGTFNYLQEVVPGDYLVFWAFEDRDSYERILGSLYAQFNCVPTREGARGKRVDLNAWDSGLKFFGTVEGVRLHETMGAMGRLNVGFTLSAHGCTEFGNNVYYDDQVKFSYRNSVQFMGTLGLSAKSFLLDSGTVNTSVAIPFLAYLWLGRGPTKVNVDPSGLSVEGNGGVKDTPNRALEIPKTLQRIFGVDGAGSKGVFSDLLQFFIGVEKYDRTMFNSEDWEKILPDLKAADATFEGLYASGTALDDQFWPSPLDVKNTTVWALMGTYLNPPMNEMYVAWKPDPNNGRLRPTVVVRRLPLVSDDYMNASDQGTYPTTAFSKLPRWVVNPRIVRAADIGRNNASRINAVYVNGSIPMANDPTRANRYNRVVAPPCFNGADIYRYGLRSYFVTAPAYIDSLLKKSENNPGKFFTAMMSDVLMDQHLRFSGSITMVGRQEPITVGDNIVYNGILFHIEQVAHSGSIGPDGRKTFDTTVWVSNGLPLTVLDPRSSDQQKDDVQTKIEKIVKNGEVVTAGQLGELSKQLMDDAAKADLDGYRLLTKRNERTDLQETATTLGGTVTFTRTK